jgi:hypothetical protein
VASSETASAPVLTLTRGLNNFGSIVLARMKAKGFETPSKDQESYDLEGRNLLLARLLTCLIIPACAVAERLRKAPDEFDEELTIKMTALENGLSDFIGELSDIDLTDEYTLSQQDFLDSKYMLCVTEIAEASEKRDLKDLAADLPIRIGHICAGMEFDQEAAIEEEMDSNLRREAKHGKKC